MLRSQVLHYDRTSCSEALWVSGPLSDALVLLAINHIKRKYKKKQKSDRRLSDRILGTPELRRTLAQLG